MNQVFESARRLNATLRVPGDKSITQRAAILAAMATGPSTIRQAGRGGDIASTLQCLAKLGYPGAVKAGELQIEGNGWNASGDYDLDAGNSGTTLRLLAGALSGRPGRFSLTGDASLSRRPMARIADPLRKMGARVTLSDTQTPPVVIEGGGLQGIDYRLPVASAQVKSAVLLAGLQASGTTTVRQSVASRDHTERMLKWLGAPVSISDGTVEVKGSEGPDISGFEMQVPGDFSSAAFWLVGSMLTPLSHVRIENVGLNATRTGLLSVLEMMGATFAIEETGAEPEPLGAIEAGFTRLQAADVGEDLVPGLIDEIPLLALAATQAEGVSTITGASELRAKESDRIAGMAAGLSALGAKVEELDDGLRITGPVALNGGEVDCLGDHRLAMTFAIAALVASGPVTVRGWEAATVSYPGFEEDLKTLTNG